MDEKPGGWHEDNSQTFIDYGRYFVPEREYQMQLICDLIPAGERPFQVLELCCGEGLLAEALLQRFASATVHGYDGSEAMLARARERLAAYGGRFLARLFDLAAADWRTPAWQARAVVSSLAVHHLEGSQKCRLFEDVYKMLQPGGAFVVADVILPASNSAAAVAAEAWDSAVHERALRYNGDLRAMDSFERERWNMFRYPEEDAAGAIDKPSLLLDQLSWLAQAGFKEVDVYWMKAGHAVFGGTK